jgi:hypothetical protein
LGLFFQLLYYRYFHPNGKPLLVNRAAKCCWKQLFVVTWNKTL